VYARGQRCPNTGRVPVQRPQSLHHGRTADGRLVQTRSRRDRDQPVPATQRRRRRRRQWRRRRWSIRRLGRVGRAAAGHQPAERDRRVRAPREPDHRAPGPVPDEPQGVRGHFRTSPGPRSDPRAPRVRRGVRRGVLHRLFRGVRARVRRAARVHPDVRLLAAAQPARGQPGEPRVPGQPPARVHRPRNVVRPAADQRAGHALRRGRLPRLLRRPVHRTGPAALWPRYAARSGNRAPAHRARAGQRPPQSVAAPSNGAQRDRGGRLAHRTARGT